MNTVLVDSREFPWRGLIQVSSGVEHPRQSRLAAREKKRELTISTLPEDEAYLDFEAEMDDVDQHIFVTGF